MTRFGRLEHENFSSMPRSYINLAKSLVRSQSPLRELLFNITNYWSNIEKVANHPTRPERDFRWTHSISAAVTRSFETQFGWPMTIANVFFERFFPRLSDTTRHTTRKTEWIMNRKLKCCSTCARASPVLRRYSIDCVKSVLGKHK